MTDDIEAQYRAWAAYQAARMAFAEADTPETEFGLRRAYREFGKAMGLDARGLSETQWVLGRTIERERAQRMVA